MELPVECRFISSYLFVRDPLDSPYFRPAVFEPGDDTQLYTGEAARGVSTPEREKCGGIKKRKKGVKTMDYSEIIRFHGHECPGLAIGYRMASAGMEELHSLRAADEEIVAIVENDACGVDALQYVTGCTFGKGNLVFRDYGKQVYTMYSRSGREGVRVVFHGKGVPDGVQGDRMGLAKWILKAPVDQILSVTHVSIKEPEPARVRRSITCASCGELVMESRVREIEGRRLCIPCADARVRAQVSGPAR
jgi:formylmethanofuran dehydrogenase subunit E